MFWTRNELKSWSVLVFIGTTLVYSARSALPVVSGKFDFFFVKIDTMIMTFNLNRHFFPRERDRKKTTEKVLVRDEFEWDNNELGKVMGSFRQQGFLLG